MTPVFAYCPTCGAACARRVPEGGSAPRDVCEACGRVHYQNPKLVVGVVATWEERILLCKRAIEPRSGCWTIPAGFMEIGETTRAGAAREAFEEAGVSLEVGRLMAVYELTHVQQVMLVYRAQLTGPELAPGVESLEAGLFGYDEIPWEELAFPTVRWALRYYDAVRGLADYPPQTNPSDERL